MSSEDAFTRWTGLHDSEVSEAQIYDVLWPLKDDLWVSAACVDRILDEPGPQRALLDLGLERTKTALERCRAALAVDQEDGVSNDQALKDYMAANPTDARLLTIRAVLRRRLTRLNTFVELCKALPAVYEDEIDLMRLGSSKENDLGGEDWEDDPWGVDGSTGDNGVGKRDNEDSKPKRIPSPLPLSQFLVQHLARSASLLAALEHIDALRVLWRRHAPTLWLYRFSILETIPEPVNPSEYYDLLPVYDPSAEAEGFPPEAETDEEWTETSAIQSLLLDPEAEPVELTSLPERMNGATLSAWYIVVTARIVASTGMPDPALELLQHGAGQGIPNLDEAGEDLSLLSRLIYDAPTPPSGVLDDWTLDKWRSLSPGEGVRAYLQHATPVNVVPAIRSLVLPYLYVHEARAERSGKPDPQLLIHTLENYVLDTSLELDVSIFEASKPGIPASQRLIRSDEAAARLGLATLYGSDRRDAWDIMARILEALPAWENRDEDNSSAETTLASLGAFVAPTTARAKASPAELLLFFKPLPAVALSRAIDILDVHIESGVILAHWGVPAPLRWFLQSHDDIDVQRSWAVRMARQASDLGEHVDTEDMWQALLDDMLKLSRHGTEGLRGAFGLLDRDEIIRIFFSGLISSGDFAIARSLVHKTKGKLQLAPLAIEDICLACSREFYDNASSGNYKVGDMKLAYDCLSIPAPSERIIKEKEFIEATSRIVSFNVVSRGGVPITPLEIRLTQDKLSLISRVMGSTSDAYKHVDMVLELADKLGFRGDAGAQAAVLAMVADAALQAEDFNLAQENCSRLVQQVLALGPSTDEEQARRANNVAWLACYQLGRQPEYTDVDKKKVLLGRALELCPPEQMPDVLAAWRKLDSEMRSAHAARSNEQRGRSRRARKATEDTHFLTSPLLSSAAGTLGAGASSLAARLQSLRAGASSRDPASPLASAPDAAAMASRALGRVAGAFSFMESRRDRSVDSARISNSEREGSLSRPGSTAPGQIATRALSKGIGWLIGDGEQ